MSPTLIIIGCCLIDATCVDKATAAGLSPAHFSGKEQDAWVGIVEQRAADKPVDLSGLALAMGSKCPLQTLMDAENSAPTTAHFETALQQVLWDYSSARISVAADSLSASIKSGMPREEVVGRIEKLGAMAASLENRSADMGAAVDSVVTTLKNAIEKKPDTRKHYPLPFKALDVDLGKVYGHEFVIVAARPSVGKTSFCTQWATECVRVGYNVAFFALEASAEQVVAQITSQVARVNMQDLGRELPENMRRGIEVAEKIKNSKKLRVFDRDMTIDAIEARCRLVADWADIVFIDHLALIRNGKAGSRYETVTDTCHRILETKKRMKGPVVLANQLKRVDIVKGDDGEVFPRPPGLMDMRDSGAAEEDASRVLFVHFPHLDFHGQPQMGIGVAPPNTRDYYVMQAKHRYGQRDVNVRCRYYAPHTLFLPYSL